LSPAAALDTAAFTQATIEIVASLNRIGVGTPITKISQCMIQCYRRILSQGVRAVMPLGYGIIILEGLDTWLSCSGHLEIAC
jgi:hypothetical protein